MTYKSIRDQFLTSDNYQMYYVRYREEEFISVTRSLEGDGILNIDIGHTMATFLSQKRSLKYVNIEAAEYLNKIISESAREVDGLNVKVLSIYNCGILFEPSLSMDVKSILKGLSKKYAIIILWDGVVLSNGKLVWDAQKEDIGFDFKDINIKEIKINYEV